MRRRIRIAWGLAAAGLLAMAVTAGPAAAISTLTQFDPKGSGAYSITGISSWDWQDTGSLVIESTLVDSTYGAIDLDTFFAIANTGDMLTFKIHAQARLAGFTGATDASGKTLALGGAGTGDYEVTATLDATETAVFTKLQIPNPVNPAQLLVDQRILTFLAINGTFQYYLDSTPDSVVATGAGFNNGDATVGDPFLWGAITGVGGSFTVDLLNAANTSGASNLAMVIDGYNSDVIETDPASAGAWLVGTTFQSNINLTTQLGTTDYLGKGLAIGTPLAIGDDPYAFLRGDVVGGTLRGANGELILRADASSTFTAVPEPGTMILLGSGLLGLAGVGRRRMKKAA